MSAAPVAIISGDKVVVLGAGKLLEVGSPKQLLQNKDGYFRKLVDASGEKDILEDLANGDRGGSK